MKIGLDARMFAEAQLTGIPRCVCEIIKEWKENYPQHEYYLFTNTEIELPFEVADNWHIICEPWIINKGKLWTVFQLPKMIKKYNLDVFWGTNYVLPHKVRNTKYYVTIYDLALLKFKGIGNFSNILRVRLFARMACKRANKVIAISEATARDVNECFKIREEKIKVSYCGGLPSEYTKSNPDKSEVNEALVFPEDFFLFISTIEPRKNLITIIKAYEEFREITKQNVKLVLAGKRGWQCDDIYEAVEKSAYKSDIIMPGFISDADKSYLLSNAKVFLYPSLYEGFGIPILEAMEYGIPTVTSNISSMPEVGGEAVLYLTEVEDFHMLAGLMEQAHNMSEDECIKLREKMQSQLTQFSWKRNAKEMLDIFLEN